MALSNYLSGEKKMTVEYAETEEGFYISANNKKVPGIQKIGGAITYISVLISADDTGYVTVIFKNEKQGGKVAAAAAASLVNPLLMAGAAYGVVKGSTLEKDVFRFLESYIASAVPEVVVIPSSTAGDSAGSHAQAAVEDHSGQNSAQVAATIFCTACGAQINGDAKFCSVCGSKVYVTSGCPRCSAELLENQRFCHECGYDTQAGA